MCNCPMCSMGLTASCLGTSSESSPASLSLESDLSPTLSSTDHDDGSKRTRSGSRGGHRGRKVNPKDEQSSGRKLAARLYPLDRNAPCEWREKADCGGLKGIVGCLTGLQQARHHGPDKSVNNNEQGNVWRICHACHNRWHSANDEDYNWNATVYAPHNPRPMSPEEMQQALFTDLKYRSKKQPKIKED